MRRPVATRAFRGIEGTLGIAPWKLLLVGLGVVGGVLGLRELRQRHEDKQYRRRGLLRGSSMLKTIAKESRTPAEYARRADAWNASEARPLPTAKIAKAYRGKLPLTVVIRLLQQAREERLEKREHLWSKMSRGLRGLVG